MPKTKAKSGAATKAKPVVAKVVAAPVVAKDKVMPAQLFGGQVMIGSFLAELLGTFALTGVVLVGSGSPLIAAMAVLVLVIAFNKVSGGHFNPAVSIGLMLAGKMPAWRTASFVVAQVLGALLALTVVTKFITVGTAMIDPSSGLPMTQAFAVKVTDGHWEQFLAEAVGALIFGLGIGSIAYSKKEGVEAGLAAGLSLFLGLVMATLGSAAVLNPAVALGVSAYTANGWTWVAYALGPIVGMTVGIWLFRLMQWDSMDRRKA